MNTSQFLLTVAAGLAVSSALCSLIMSKNPIACCAFLIAGLYLLAQVLR